METKSVKEYVKEVKEAVYLRDEQHVLVRDLAKYYEDLADIKHCNGFLAVYVPYDERFVNYAKRHHGAFFMDDTKTYAPAWFFEEGQEEEIRHFIHNEIFVRLDSDPVDTTKFLNIAKEFKKHYAKFPVITYNLIYEAFIAFSKGKPFYLDEDKSVIIVKAPYDSSFSRQVVELYGYYLSDMQAWAINYRFFKNEVGRAYKQFLDEQKLGEVA